MQLQTLCVFNSLLTLGVQFLSCLYLKIYTAINEKILHVCVKNDDDNMCMRKDRGICGKCNKYRVKPGYLSCVTKTKHKTVGSVLH